MNGLILGVDAWNNGTKVAGPYGLDISRTAICGWFERNAEEAFGDDDTEFEIGGSKGYAGSIAKYAFGGGSMFGDTKAHDDTKIRVLFASERPDTSYSPDTYENPYGVLTMETIYEHPFLTTWFIMCIGFWSAAAAEQFKSNHGKKGYLENDAEYNNCKLNN